VDQMKKTQHVKLPVQAEFDKDLGERKEC